MASSTKGTSYGGDHYQGEKLNF
ncbi:hypothetical protein CCACVL1_27169 [Corchorus capsularis]|uniref:Uncharacterized protein n=1 Tax=Corchorus capsularis TaxID=210143 RepID=A0A1R3GBX9_COCAP|nr:hypothetical protein CCACVL1_27169 [Corchorus capsularis]